MSASPAGTSGLAAPSPFHVSQGAPPAARRRLLLVSHAFPPDSSMGALRWQKLLEYAATRGWSADVLMMDPSEAPMRDDSRLASLPPGIRLFGVPLPEHTLMAAEQWLRRRVARVLRGGNGARAAGVATSRTSAPGFTGPIAEPGLAGRLRLMRRAYLARLHYARWARWAERAAAVGVSLGRESPYDLVVSSGPPQMAHEAARLVAARLGIPFVMDLRDQFFADDTQPPELRSGTWLAITKRYERRCVEAARLVVMNTAAMEAIMHRRYPELPGRFMTVMNGADPDIRSTRPLAPVFTITHTGSLYNGRDPRGLLRGLRLAVEQLGVTPAQLRCTFMGGASFGGIPVTRIAEEEGIADFVDVLPTGPRAASLRVQEESAMLVILPQFQAECIPGKVFEYVQLSSWVLALTEPGTAVELLLRGTTADLAAPGDTEGIAALVVRRFREFSAGVRPVPVNADGRFDRATQGRELFDALDALLPVGGSGAADTRRSR